MRKTHSRECLLYSHVVDVVEYLFSPSIVTLPELKSCEIHAHLGFPIDLIQSLNGAVRLRNGRIGIEQKKKEGCTYRAEQCWFWLMLTLCRNPFAVRVTVENGNVKKERF